MCVRACKGAGKARTATRPATHAAATHARAHAHALAVPCDRVRKGRVRGVLPVGAAWKRVRAALWQMRKRTSC